MTTGLRMLQVLADTDDSVPNRRGLNLHARLAEAGIEVRTIALSPGGRGEHAALLPVVAPARRTIAALTGLRVESRWADVTVFHGPRSIPPGWRLLRSAPPSLVVLGDGERLRGDRRDGGSGRSAKLRPVVIDPDDEPGPSEWLALLRELAPR